MWTKLIDEDNDVDDEDEEEEDDDEDDDGDEEDDFLKWFTFNDCIFSIAERPVEHDNISNPREKRKKIEVTYNASVSNQEQDHLVSLTANDVDATHVSI